MRPQSDMRGCLHLSTDFSVGDGVLLKNVKIPPMYPFLHFLPFIGQHCTRSFIGELTGRPPPTVTPVNALGKRTSNHRAYAQVSAKRAEHRCRIFPRSSGKLLLHHVMIPGSSRQITIVNKITTIHYCYQGGRN